METMEANGDADKQNIIEKLGRFCPFGLKICQPVYLDEENLNMMSVSSESLIFDGFGGNNGNNGSQQRRKQLNIT